jgi:hypothetical protein
VGRGEKRHGRKLAWPIPNFSERPWDVVLDAWEEVAHIEGYAATQVESLPPRMQMVIDSEGVLDAILNGSNQTALLRAT